MDFSSVDDFLRKAQASKQNKRDAIANEINPWLEDVDTYAMLPSMALSLDDLVASCGDEALKQVAVVALGKWLQIHEQRLSEEIFNDDVNAALVICTDMASLGQAIRLADGVGSFGGAKDYIETMKKEINQTVLETLESHSMQVEDMFDDPLR